MTNRHYGTKEHFEALHKQNIGIIEHDSWSSRGSCSRCNEVRITTTTVATVCSPPPDPPQSGSHVWFYTSHVVSRGESPKFSHNNKIKMKKLWSSLALKVWGPCDFSYSPRCGHAKQSNSFSSLVTSESGGTGEKLNLSNWRRCGWCWWVVWTPWQDYDLPVADLDEAAPVNNLASVFSELAWGNQTRRKLWAGKLELLMVQAHSSLYLPRLRMEFPYKPLQVGDFE